MKKLFILFVLLPVWAEDLPKAKILPDGLKAELYKALADSISASSQLELARRKVQDLEKENKEKMEVFTAKRKSAEDYCGTPLVESSGKLADCSPPTPKEEKK
jgi:hypothetical protein